jgi:hypothetical protein
MRIKNLIPNSIVKTSSTNTLIAVDTINISEVAGLQTELNDINNDIKSVITNPIQSNLNMAGFNITNVNNITGQAPNSTVTISDENISIQGSTTTIIGTSTGFVRINAFDTILTTTGSNAVQCLRGLDMKNNVLTNTGGITLTGPSRQIINPVLSGASCVSSFNMSGNNITNANFISGIIGVSTLTLSNQNINIEGGVTTNIGTATGSATISALNTILTTTGTNAVQCLKTLDMKNNDIINVNDLSVASITCSNISGTIPVNNDFNLGTIHHIYDVNELTANTIETLGNIHLYKFISPDIYVNASLMRQTCNRSVFTFCLRSRSGRCATGRHTGSAHSCRERR